MEESPGKIVCILCKGVIHFSHQNSERFMSHLKYEHNVHFYINLLLIFNLMDKKTLKDIIVKFEETYCQSTDYELKKQEKITTIKTFTLFIDEIRLF